MKSNAPGPAEVVVGRFSTSGWSRRRWATLLVLVFVVQLAFLFALGDRQPVKPRVVQPVVVRRSESPFAALQDPTLFALPNAHGVAGLTWLKTPVVARAPFRWTTTPRLLALPAQDLGLAFSQSWESNSPANLTFAAKPEPETLILVAPAISAPPLVTNSALRITRDLAARRWLNPPLLRSWAGTNLLAPSVVQALVDAEGNVRSLALMPPGSGSRDADEYALQVVRQARFAAGRKGEASALGELIFRWHTEPLAATPP